MALAAVGARIRVVARLGPSRMSQIREVVAGTGFFADVPRIQTFGLGTANDARVTIIWPNDCVQSLGRLLVNRR